MDHVSGGRHCYECVGSDNLKWLVAIIPSSTEEGEPGELASIMCRNPKGKGDTYGSHRFVHVSGRRSRSGMKIGCRIIQVILVI